MNEREATDLLHRLAGGVREVPPPVDRLVAGGRALRRRRLRNVVGAAAVVGAVLSGGAIALGAEDGAGRDARFTERDQQPTTPPTAAPGMRMVGLGRVVVEVPEAWMAADQACARDDAMVVRSPGTTEAADGEDGCPSFSRLEPWASLVVGDTTTPEGADAITASVWSREVEVDGLTVSQTSYHSNVPAFCRPVGTPGLQCDLLFWIPEEDAYFHLFARGPEARETVVAIRDSIRILPEGYTTVPFIKQWTEDAEAAQALDEAGLEAELPGVDWPHSVMATDPQVGSVIEVGGAVRLIPGDG